MPFNYIYLLVSSPSYCFICVLVFKRIEGQCVGRDYQIVLVRDIRYR